MKKKQTLWYGLLFLIGVLGTGGVIGQKVYVHELWKPTADFLLSTPSELLEGTEPDLPEEPEESGISAEVKEGLPQPEEEKIYTFSTVDSSYFDDALLIGDSRTVGLYEYGLLTGADFFADVGMSLYKLGSFCVKVGEKELTLEELLEEKDYGKIYLMLGINELGYDFETTVKKYRALAEELRVKEPEAVIYLCANLHVTKKLSESEKLFNNRNINRFNEEVSKMADQKHYFYLDINELFDDEEGNLNADYTSDDAHVRAKYYTIWSEWLCTRAIVK